MRHLFAEAPQIFGDTVMYLHEVQILYRWYCYIPVLIVGFVLCVPIRHRLPERLWNGFFRVLSLWGYTTIGSLALLEQESLIQGLGLSRQALAWFSVAVFYSFYVPLISLATAGVCIMLLQKRAGRDRRL